jgi:triacylglycerol lipase
MHMPVLRHPIIFAHGLLGFDYLRLGPFRLAGYWSKLPETVRAAGNRVFVARVAPIGSVTERAGQLRAFIEQNCPDEEVHVIGHSMGGLDARYMISKLGMASRVLSLTTLGTPHRGTPFADWGLRRLWPVFSGILNLFGISSQAIEDLSVAACRRFNDDVQDASGVRYFSVGGQFQSSWLTPSWHLSWRVIQQEEGANDGLVPVTSASHGEEFSLWEGHHLSLINFPDPIRRWPDRTPAFAGLLQRLCAAGF